MTALLTRCLRRDVDGDVHEVGQVLWYDDAIHVISVEPGGDEAIRSRLLTYRVGGADGVLEPSAGEEYVRCIPESLIGSRFWASAVIEVPDEAAAALAERARVRL